MADKTGIARLAGDFVAAMASGKRSGRSIASENQRIAELLGSSPEALAAFETAYSRFEVEAPLSENLFEVNSRQAAALARESSDSGLPQAMIEEIVADLHADQAASDSALGAIAPAQQDAEAALMQRISDLPEGLRPQLTATAVARDIEQPAYPMFVSLVERARQESDPRRREQMLLQVNAMLDTLDLDPVMYRALGQNPTAMGNWLPRLQEAVLQAESALRIPETRVRRVPLPILQLTRLDYSSLTPTTLEIVDAWAREAFGLDEDRQYFIKTGTYSHKFDFRNAHIQDPQEVREIGRYLAYIQFQANQMASPLNVPGPIVGVSTTNEWVVREWIEDESDSPTIYHGMPLRTEFRVFVDCDADGGRGAVLAVAPYWDPEVMLERFERQADAGDPAMRHDAIVFRAHLPRLMERYERLKDRVADEVRALLPHLALPGQWSLDVMLNDDAGDQLYAIDMAPAAKSALSHHVPAGLLEDREIDWLPALGTAS